MKKASGFRVFVKNRVFPELITEAVKSMLGISGAITALAGAASVTAAAFLPRLIPIATFFAGALVLWVVFAAVGFVKTRGRKARRYAIFLLRQGIYPLKTLDADGLDRFVRLARVYIVKAYGEDHPRFQDFNAITMTPPAIATLDGEVGAWERGKQKYLNLFAAMEEEL